MSKLEMIKYLKLIFNKWILWLFVLLDIVGVSIQFIIPNLNLPPIAYGFFAIVGFFWAGYQVHRETIKSYENSLELYRQKMEILSNELNIGDILKEQNISMCLKEGHEYIFDFDKIKTLEALMGNLQPDKTKQEQYFLPASELNIYLRIENIGCNVDILVIRINWEKAYTSPFDGRINDTYLTEGAKIEYPIPLQADNFLECNLKMALPPSAGITNAQFASRLKDLRESGYSHTMKIWLESVDGTGNRKIFTTEHEISFRPLVDLYIAHWRENNQHELIRLSGGVTQKVISATNIG